jgi:predicted enzyme related to lactoylglutathione lyase
MFRALVWLTLTSEEGAMEMTDYPTGTFAWVDYAAEDLDSAKRFYGELFGWSLDEGGATSTGDPYVMARLDGKDVGGMMKLPEEQAQMGVPPHWNSYVVVEDVDASASRVSDLGGQVHVLPMDLPEAGRIAVVADPTGAAFNLWKPSATVGGVLVNEPNTFCWNELYTNDLDRAETFYTALFEWKSKRASSSEGTPLVELYNGERPAATMMQIQPDWGAMPSTWGVYFAVADCEQAISRAKDLGGTVPLEPRDIPPGRFAVVQDPQGGSFSVIQLKG